MDTKTKETAPNVGMEAFFIKDTSEEGVKVDLTLPDGTATGEHLIVRGADSPTFRKALARTNRLKMDLMKRTQGSKGRQALDAGTAAMKEAKIGRELVAKLVVGWSFEQDFTQENLLKFLENAPQILEQIDQFAGDRTNFFKNPLTGSENTQEEISG